jgi:hypothetical protein
MDFGAKLILDLHWQAQYLHVTYMMQIQSLNRYAESVSAYLPQRVLGLKEMVNICRTSQAWIDPDSGTGLSNVTAFKLGWDQSSLANCSDNREQYVACLELRLVILYCYLRRGLLEPLDVNL